MKLERAMDFDRWYSCEYQRVLAVVAVVCNRRAASVEDATHDAFVKALERWDSVSVMDAPTGWVTKVAINSARRSFQRSRRREELTNSERIDNVFLDSHPDAALIAALGALSFRQRRAVVLHHVEGLSQAEVARDLDISPGTASATLHQARNRLRSALETTQESQL